MPRVFLVILLLSPLLLLGGTAWVQVGESASPSKSHSYAEHPPLGHTGGFGEPSCQACHFGGEGNAGSGALVVAGLPETVRPDRTYDLSVRLTASMKRAGFMLSVRRPDGTQVGHLRALDTTRAAVHTVDSTGIEYAHHTLAGTEVSRAEAVWSLRWDIPGGVRADSVLVHVSANAANDDASAFGDDVYTTVAGARMRE